MITKSFIYKNKLTQPYIYSRLWIEPETVYTFEIVRGNSTVTRNLELQSEVKMVIEGNSGIYKQVSDNSAIRFELVSNSTVTTNITANSDIKLTLEEDSIVYE